MQTPHTIRRDKRKRILLSKRFVSKLVHKVICHDSSKQSSSLSIWHAYKRHARALHHSLGGVQQTQIQNRCVLSGRAKGVSRFCKLSRIKIRQCAGRGLLIGVTKGSW